MPIDPVADPWGTALLVTGCLSALLLLVLAAAVVGKRRATWIRIALAVTLLGFHGSAVAGAMVNLQARGTGQPTADAATPAEQEPAPDASDEPSAEEPEVPQAKEAVDEPAGDTDGDPDEAGQEAEPTGGTEPEPAEEETPDTAGEPSGDTPPQVAAPPTPDIAPLPEDPAERRTAARLVLREGKQVASREHACTDPTRVLQAWAALDALPDDLYEQRQGVIAKRLEKCRRKIVWATGYSVGKRRSAQRDALADELETRWRDDHGLRLFATTYGRDHENLRIGSTSLKKEQVDAVWTDDLKRELAEAGFSQVAWSDGSKVWRYRLEATTDEAVVRQELQSQGLAEPLRL